MAAMPSNGLLMNTHTITHAT
ncbi:unnamed protein product [Gulo gulo]|uniref:Uncharacterized protein n=1 Tax=Gulo gulo TaxID=48420 RepID=A0A9X9LN33_GULGU|nr:unnamed protein product [Gulo gulo]